MHLISLKFCIFIGVLLHSHLSSSSQGLLNICQRLASSKLLVQTTQPQSFAWTDLTYTLTLQFISDNNRKRHVMQKLPPKCRTKIFCDDLIINLTLLLLIPSCIPYSLKCQNWSDDVRRKSTISTNLRVHFSALLSCLFSSPRCVLTLEKKWAGAVIYDRVMFGPVF